MASYQAHSQNKGTLLPGQQLTVNKFMVQVERYLAQGGFAHVYLVTTATPVFNTTRHVLKRIAVANEAMLAEVKKEVDIMRLLKGHPNIVQLIDAAWHRMPNGLYEVFILMEYCPGGGLIDMMNRRLRERLTEVEILQIFVDVCEGVATMHNLRPALLHRDLKVENILQATPTSFKLCDFGSATSVASRPPATIQEIRALEADLNRHTTLQYRAPEMVDPHLRRPVNEKSDVWALGVLLYKLCYYTTPFEEHGPLAILNVQYRIPPYPVYSPQINALIASMLREHSAQRPSVFELLSTVHAMRGTKSLFHYPSSTAQTLPIPDPIQPKPLKQVQHRKPSESLVAASPKKPAGVGAEARGKVVETLAPIRRGRPTPPKESPSRPRSGHSSPQKPSDSSRLAVQNGQDGRPHWLDESFSAEDEKAWQNVIGMQGYSNGQLKPARGANDAWGLEASRETSANAPPTTLTFDNDFRTKLWNSVTSTPSEVTDNPLKSTSTKYRPPAFTGNEPARSPTITVTKIKMKDAFGDLGLGNQNQHPAPTLGEARRLRTGLATMSTSIPSHKSDNSGQSKAIPLSSRPTPSPRPSRLLPSPSPMQSSSNSLSPSPSLRNSSWKPLNPPLLSGHDPSSLPDGLPVESRFPSLEELDASFAKRGTPDLSGEPRTRPSGALLQPSLLGKKSMDNTIPSPLHATDAHSRGRSGSKSAHPIQSAARNPSLKPTESARGTTDDQATRFPLIRRHRSTNSFHETAAQTKAGNVEAVDNSPSKLELPSLSALASRSSPRLEPKDWLTGDDNDFHSRSPVMKPSTLIPSNLPFQRASPVPSNSSVERSPLQVPQEADFPQPVQSTSANIPTAAFSTSRFSRALPSSSIPVATNQVSESSRRWRPEKSPDKGIDNRMVASTSAKTVACEEVPKNSKFSQLSSRATAGDSGKDSSSDEGPEDVRGFIPSVAKTENVKIREQPRSHKGRQSSVHDLVDLWGGSAAASSVADSHTRKRLTSTAPMSPFKASASNPIPRSISPQPIHSAPVDSRAIRQSPKLPIPEPTQQSEPPTSAGLTKSTRARPQSMFLFPVSKSISDGSSPTSPGIAGGVPSAGLMPPDELKPRASRRTSISDMVQLYESIGGGSTLSGPPLSPSKSTVLTATHVRENVLPPSLRPEFSTAPSNVIDDTDLRPAPSFSIPSDAQQCTDLGKSHSSLTRPLNSSGPRTSPVGHHGIGHSQEPNKAPPKPRPSELAGVPDSTTSEVPNVRLGTRKPTQSTEDTRKATEERPASPDHSYQGVGKLIAQWQRKSEEAGSARPPPSPRRGGTAVKKTALVTGSDKGR